MPGEKNNGGNARRRTSQRRGSALIRSVDDLGNQHGGRLQRWLTTWDAVDCSLLNRMISQARESREACQLLPGAIPLLDELQHVSEAQVSAATESVEHLIVLCQHGIEPSNGN